jgi:hypothetical protein
MEEGLGKGIEQGLPIGREEGMQHGEAVLLRRQTEHRFGVLAELLVRKLTEQIGRSWSDGELGCWRPSPLRICERYGSCDGCL